MRCVSAQYAQTWSKWLSLAEYWYSTNYHNTLEIIPFQALYGIPPPLHVPYLEGDSPLAAIDQLLKEREDVLRVLQYQLRRAQ